MNNNTMSKHKVQIIVPCYNEEESVWYFIEVFDKTTDNLRNNAGVELELIFVNDGSKDNTLVEIKEIQRKYDYVKYISFSRNFGKEAAIYAGLNEATGDIVGLMDVDLQDPPELIETMYNTIVNEGYDCVATRRADREGEPPVRSWFAKQFYKIINKISDADIVDGARDFRLMTRPMVNAILQMNEHNRFSKGIFGWVGFNTHWIAYQNRERIAGNTKWSFWKLFKYAIDGIVDFSTAFLNIPIILCGIFGIAGLIGLIASIIKLSELGIILSFISIMGSLMFMCFAIFALYLKNIVGDTQNRPIYIVKERSSKNNDNSIEQV